MTLSPATVVHSLKYVLLAIAVLVASSAHAKTSPVDDSGTVPYEPVVGMHWQALSPRGAKRNFMVGSTMVRVRLNVTPWLRHSGRIYMVLPAQLPGRISASWTSQGRLLAGQVISGNRALVYAGPITSALIEDVIRLELTVDGSQMRQAYDLSFRFEIDEN